MQGEFRLGEYLVRPSLNQIEGRGEKRTVEPKAMDVLVYLAQKAGEVLSKEQIIRAVWPDTFVTDEALWHGISELRKVFEDDARQPSYIQTIPRRGYRLVAEVVEEKKPEGSSPYRILRKIGQGGMGEVFLAEDTDLGRRVALKFMRQEKEEDEKWNRRFRREARAAAALDHPFICKVYETGILEGRSFIAMEYIEGETLREWLSKGPKPLKEALSIAREMAEALTSAHRESIVHRDIKPSNVILTKEGHVKITDFGIARRFRKEEGEPDDWTLTKTTGNTLGTPDYMSPEQIRGESGDPRSDVFCFGIVLYEMVTGIHPFRGEKTTDTTAAILGAEPPPLRHYVDDPPEGLQHIVRKMLAKEPECRHQSMKGILTDLEHLVEDSGRPVQAPVSRLWKGVGSVALLAVLVGVLFYLLSTSDEGITVSHEPIRLTSYSGFENWPSFSPDGSQIVFSNSDLYGEWQAGNLYVKLVGEGEPIPITDGQVHDFRPNWSPNGHEIAFLRADSSFTGISIWLIPALGGTARRLGQLGPAKNFMYESLAWMPGGLWLVANRTRDWDEPLELCLISTQTGEMRQLTNPVEGSWGDSFPAVSPDGRTVAFSRQSAYGVGDIHLLKLSETLEPIGEPSRLTNQSLNISGLTWTADGKRIIYSGAQGFFDSRLWMIDVEEGEPRRVSLPGDILRFPVVSRRGNRLAYTELTREDNIYSLQLTNSQVDSTSLTKVISSSRIDLLSEVSPDGIRIAFFSNRRGKMGIYIGNVDGSGVAHLTSFGLAGRPVWSPDERLIAFESLLDGQSEICVIDVESGVHRRLTFDPAEDHMARFSGDGTWIFFASNRRGIREVWKVPAEGGEAVPVTQGYLPQASPDGQYLYFLRGRISASVKLWRMPMDGGNPELVRDLGVSEYYEPIQEGVFFTVRGANNERMLNYLDLTSKRITPCGRLPDNMSSWFWDITPDGRKMFFSKVDREDSDIMLVENFP